MIWHKNEIRTVFCDRVDNKNPHHLMTIMANTPEKTFIAFLNNILIRKTTRTHRQRHHGIFCWCKFAIRIQFTRSFSFVLSFRLVNFIVTVTTAHRVYYAQYAKQLKCHFMGIMAFSATCFIFYLRKWFDPICEIDRIHSYLNNLSLLTKEK